jgi:hypothetical protein
MRGRRLSPVRVATGVALGAWAAVFWFLLVSGRTSLYLSSRTAWVVPTGAAVLTVAAAGRLVTARTSRPERVPSRMSWALGFVVLPAVIVLALPPTALGSYAASRRSLSAGVASGPALEAGAREASSLRDLALRAEPPIRRAWHRALQAMGTDVTAASAHRSCLVLAPHLDDETLGCGATILRRLRWQFTQ